MLSDLSYKGHIFFTPKDLQVYDNNSRSLIDNLSRKKWILKIRNGVYLIVPLEAGKRGAENYTIHSFSIASVLADPYYIGYLSALNFHGLTDKTSSIVYVAAQDPHRSRIILDTKIKFITVTPRKFFGIVATNIENQQVLLSSREKTIVDCLDRPAYCEGVEEIARAIYFGKKELDFAKLVSMSKKLGNGAVLKRLGHISDRLNIRQLIRLMEHINVSSGYSLLDPTVKRKGKIIEKWKIVANVNIDPKKWTQ